MHRPEHFRLITLCVSLLEFVYDESETNGLFGQGCAIHDEPDRRKVAGTVVLVLDSETPGLTLCRCHPAFPSCRTLPIRPEGHASFRKGTVRGPCHERVAAGPCHVHLEQLQPVKSQQANGLEVIGPLIMHPEKTVIGGMVSRPSLPRDQA